MMRLKKFYNFILAIITILNGYAFSFFRGFSLAMILASFFAVLSTIMFVQKRGLFISSPFIAFAIFASLFSVIPLTLSNNYDLGGFLYTSAKLMVWALFISFSSYLFFDFSSFCKYLKFVIVITFIYLVFQYVAHYALQISMPCTFDFGIIKSNYDVYIREYASDSSIFRPGSLWAEPGYLGYFYNGFLAIVLFSDGKLFSRRIQKRFFLLITISGIVMSMSTGAIGIMTILLLYRFLNRRKQAPFKAIVSISIIFALVYFAIKFNWISIFSGISKSLDNSIYKLQHLDSVGRVGQSYHLISLLAPFNKVFGVGIGNEKTIFGEGYYYMNGYTTLHVWNGAIGVIVWIGVLLYLLRTKCKTPLQKVMILVISVVGLFSGIFFGAHSFLYFIVAVGENPNGCAIKKSGRPNYGYNSLRIIQ